MADQDENETPQQNGASDGNVATANGGSTNGASANGKSATDGAGQGPIQARVLAQFIRDLSFEVPSVGRLMKRPGDNPNMAIEINVSAQHIEDARFESAIEFTAKATDSEGPVYDLEIVYGGVFEIGRIPQQALEPFLLVNCPSLLFPYLRRIASDLTRESGFQPLLLDPIDFGQLYIQRKQQEEAGSGNATPPTANA